MNPVRIVIADDHTLVLEGIREILSDRFEVVGTALNGRELIQVVRQEKPDVVITDISMPELNGLDASIKLLNVLPQLKFVFLTASDSPELVEEAFRSGARGFVVKRSAASELLRAIEAVSQGGTYITPLVTGGVLNSLLNREPRNRNAILTVRQREILQLLAEGKTMKQSAQILHLTPRTIAFHKYRIMDRLAVSNSAELLRYAYRSGLLQT